MTNADLPFSWPLTVTQGATFRRTFQWTNEDGDDADLTDWDALMHVRRYAGAETVLAELTGGDGITLGADGMIELHLPADVTALLPATRGVYELRLMQPDDGDVIAFAVGPFTVRPAVVAAAAEVEP